MERDGCQAILRITDASRGRPPASPVDLFVAIHRLAAGTDGVSLRKIIDGALLQAHLGENKPVGRRVL